MSLKVAIFEDDTDVADLLKDMMESKDFEATSYYSLKDGSWKQCDVILGDYRNKIVPFKILQEEAQKNGIPLLAISGSETAYLPQLIKPFSIEELQSSILDLLMNSRKSKHIKKDSLQSGLFSAFFKKWKLKT